MRSQKKMLQAKANEKKVQTEQIAKEEEPRINISCKQFSISLKPFLLSLSVRSLSGA